MIGQEIGNYVVKRKIGQGGMGAVYLAEHARLGKKVAVKVLLPQMSASKEMTARFFNEARAATEIHNPHIVDVLDFGELPDGSSYIVMEWLEGQSLQQLLSTEPRLPVARVAHIADGIARALGAAHAHGIVHRDLKPDNIFLVRRDDDPDFVKILDFGIAKLSVDSTDVRTQAGAILGTPHYMSPEQCNGGNVDRRADVYAMGVILYQMLAGRLPFSATKLTELLIAHATQPPPPLSEAPPAVAGAVMQALEKDPERRFDSVTALARAFDQSLSLPPTSAPPQARRSPVLWILPLALIAVILGGILVFRRPPAPPPKAPAESSETAIEAPRAAVDHSGKWLLQRTDCLPGSVPSVVQVTQVGNALINRAAGFPETRGSVEADGRFKYKNALGTCSGRVAGNVATETCTNKLHLSCHVTYQRAD